MRRGLFLRPSESVVRGFQPEPVFAKGPGDLMATVPIRPGTVTVVLSGAGGGTAKIGPTNAREVWSPEVASVSVATNTNEAQCRLYVGDAPTANNFVDGTLSGSTGDSTDRVSGRPVPLGDFIWAVWAGGDPGSVATLNVTGMRTV